MGSFLARSGKTGKKHKRKKKKEKKHFSSHLVLFVFLKAAAGRKQEPWESWTSIPGKLD